MVDKTELTGTYNISLTCTPDRLVRDSEPEAGDISLFLALQDQLGLRLEQRKVVMEIYLVDHVEKPSGN